MTVCDERLSDERLSDELQALAAIFGESFSCHPGGRGCEIALAATPAVWLTATFPPGYPHAAAELSVHGGAAAEVLSAQMQVRQLATAAAEHGEECVWQAAQAVLALLEQLEDAQGTDGTADGDRGQAGGVADAGVLDGEREGEEQEPQAAEAEREEARQELCVVLIDHMNHGARYSRKIAAWARQLGLTGWQLSRAGKGKGSRLEGVIVLLQGWSEAVSQWLTRLRTEQVDVNAKGLRCKERQSTVLVRAPAPEASLARCAAGQKNVDDAGQCVTQWVHLAYDKAPKAHGADRAGAAAHGRGGRRGVEGGGGISSSSGGGVDGAVCSGSGAGSDDGASASALVTPERFFAEMGLLALFDAFVAPAL